MFYIRLLQPQYETMSTLREIALIIGGICSGVSIVLSVYSVSCHLVYTRHVALKAFTTRILLMVPIYAAEAILGESCFLVP
jgi:uncharacterized membrane protein YbhN (UPF0104 family)